MGRRVASLVLVSVPLAGLAGCGSGKETDEPAYAASGGLAVPDVPDEPTTDFAASQSGSSLPDQSRSQPGPMQTEQMQPPPMQNGAGGNTSPAPAPGLLPLADGGAASPEAPIPEQLRSDLTAQELVKVLSTADSDMEVIVSGQSGIQDPERARETLLKIIRLKLEASRRLASGDSYSPKQRSAGARGELQSLSHLASLGDVQSAEELEELAKANLKSGDAKLVSDSRLVLIGFAIEDLQNGEEDAPKRIVDYVDQMAAGTNDSDVPAMMVMGQARSVLSGYGHDAEAKRVRDAILDLFGDSPQSSIAQMAAQMAGNVRFDDIDGMLENVVQGQVIDVAVWREAAETLVDESADLQTVQYLAGAALDFESLDRDELVAATYQVLQRRFADPETATGREVAVAVQAHQARRNVIGRVFDPDLPTVASSGQAATPIRMEDYRGKVVLMPFWATGFPESLQLIGDLEALVDQYPEQVAIVGMNLDPQGSDVLGFVEQNSLGFPSFRAESSPQESGGNPVAARFGLVSMPFVAILDQTGQVAELDFSGRQLKKTVERLVKR